MTLKIALSPETAAKLRERAAAEGKDMESFVREVVEEKLAAPNAATPVERMSAEQWSAQWHAWAASHPKSEFQADDSRDSIYAGRG